MNRLLIRRAFKMSGSSSVVGRYYARRFLLAAAAALALTIPAPGDSAAPLKIQTASVKLAAPKAAPTPDAASSPTKTDPQGTQFFETRIRPLLAQKCYACHSVGQAAGAGQVKGGLRLDTRDGVLKGGNSGPVIVPGDPDHSRLIEAVRYTNPALQMPPTGKLSDKEIGDLVTWVRMGAPDPRTGAAPVPTARKPINIEEGRKHWAFQPLANVTPPPAKQGSWWVRTPIDNFIFDKLNASGLKPNPVADRRTLIRRAYFDLVGLPPSPEEVDAFLNDRQPDAYPRLVDRLLASPHYGERWARHWLDLARFAESHGFEQDYDRPYAYQYRDFVIRALNTDLPYNRFVQWQLAGDEMEPDNPDALTATGFLGAGVHSTQITKNQVEKERYDELDDMLSTTGTAFLGLTIGCARCHDHKYDPIPTRDYYRMLSTFTTTVRSDMDVDMDPAGYQKAKAAFDLQHAPLQAALQQYEHDALPGRLEEWLKTPRPQAVQPQWEWLSLDKHESAGGATFTEMPDGSLLATGTNPDYDTYTFVAHTSLQGITGIRLEALSDPSMVKGGPGRAANGNFALTDFQVTAAPRDGSAPPVPVKLQNPRTTFEQKGLPVAATIDDDPKSAWAVDPQFGKDHAAAFDLAAPLGFKSGTVLTFTLKFENNTGHNIGRPRLSVTTLPQPPLNGATLPEREIALLNAVSTANPHQALAAMPEKDRTDLLKWFGPMDAGWQALNKKVQESLAHEPKPKLEKAMICSEGVPAIRFHTQGDDFFKETYFLRRGDPSQKEGVADQGFLQVLERGPDSRWKVQPPAGWRTSYRRRSLANWITDPQDGAGVLLARVIVNRLWQHHFGRGLVATPSDFGTQGDPPSHPELLDWLAGELIRNGWRLKPIQRMMMTSAAYMQSAAVSPEKRHLDPENRLVSRFTRRRLEAEAIRDSMLSMSGELDLTMFGPGSLDESMKRRSIYFTIKRSQLIPSMRVFDAPDALEGIPGRTDTTIAPQALMMMNNVNVRDWARHFAQRIAPTPETPLETAVRAGYQMAVCRAPTDADLKDSVAFIQQQAASYHATGSSNPREAALADFCQVLMSLNEFVFVD